MKKILAILVLGLLWCNVGFAEIRVIDEKLIDPPGSSAYYINTLCIDGHKFVFSKGGGKYVGSSRTMVQFFERHGQFSLPAQC